MIREHLLYLFKMVSNAPIGEILKNFEELEQLLKPIITRDHPDISEKFDEHVLKIREACSTLTSSDNSTLRPSYASVLKRTSRNGEPGYLPTVLISPTNPGQKSSETFKCIREAVNIQSGQIHIENTKFLRNGSVLITARDNKSITTIKGSLHGVSDKLTVRAPFVKFPYLKIKSVDKNITDEDFVNCFISQNNLTTHIHKSSVKLVRTINKQRSTDKVIQCHPEIWQSIMEDGRAAINWNRCYVVNYIPITRCYHCQAFGHKASDCKVTKPTCCNCGKDHETSRCVERESSCINCLKHGLKSAKNHNAASPECKYYLKIRDSISKSIVYKTDCLNV